ncbi:MAG: hypothetical protein FI687_03290 [SAR202 cluster bacterium]|nr:hypothetical protein [SAR202 cluster bacterium]
MSMVKTSVLVVFVALLTLSAIPAFAQSGSGTAIVSDDKGSSDAITITMTGVTAPASGKQFVGWLASEYRKVSIGIISVDSNGAVSHTHNSSSSLYSGLNLIRNYNALMITEENEGAIPSSPSTSIIYSAVIPKASIAHIRKLLSGSTTGSTTGILADLKTELQVASDAATAASNATTASVIDDYLKQVIDAVEGSVLSTAASATASATAANAADTGDSTDNYTSVAANYATVNTEISNVTSWATSARDLAVSARAKSDVALKKGLIGPGGGTIIAFLAAGSSGVSTDASAGGVDGAVVAAQNMATYNITAVTLDESKLTAPAAGDNAVPVLVSLMLGLALMSIAVGSFIVYRRKDVGLPA